MAIIILIALEERSGRPASAGVFRLKPDVPDRGNERGLRNVSSTPASILTPAPDDYLLQRIAQQYPQKAQDHADVQE